MRLDERYRKNKRKLKRMREKSKNWSGLASCGIGLFHMLTMPTGRTICIGRAKTQKRSFESSLLYRYRQSLVCSIGKMGFIFF